jgi:hypothetical protein
MKVAYLPSSPIRQIFGALLLTRGQLILGEAAPQIPS